MRSAPEIAVNRLAVYLRFLEDYAKNKGSSATINSQELAESLDINPHQIRKDLSYFGKFGSRGIGYRAGELRDKIRQILGLNKRWNLCLCGLGNLGSALFTYRGFRKKNLHIVAIFDNDPKKIGRVFKGVKVYHPKDIFSVAKKLQIEIAIITTPSDAAEEITARLLKAGIRAILNFAPVKLSIPRESRVRSVDLSTELNNLTYFLSTLA